MQKDRLRNFFSAMGFATLWTQKSPVWRGSWRVSQKRWFLEKTSLAILYNKN